jgi:hypothetical protein
VRNATRTASAARRICAGNERPIEVDMTLRYRSAAAMSSAAACNCASRRAIIEPWPKSR